MEPKQYIDKSALVAEIEKRIQELHPTNTHKMQVGEKVDRNVLMWLNALTWVKKILETLEVKEVDFESEWKKYFCYRGDVATVNIKHLAKHFFELGLKAQKEEFKKESEINCPNFDEAQGTPITK